MKHGDAIQKLEIKQLFIFSLLLFFIAIAGIRFSDGGMLLAIARGQDVGAPIFSNIATQYIWDSPLKIFILKILPGRVDFIALVFLFFAFLPLIYLFSKNKVLFFLGFILVFLTPAFKICIQNIGVGDGLVFTLIVFLCFSQSYMWGGIIFLLIALWHPQQSFFILVSYILAKYCYVKKMEWRQIWVMVISLGLAALVFIIYKHSLDFKYSGRWHS